MGLVSVGAAVLLRQADCFPMGNKQLPRGARKRGLYVGFVIWTFLLWVGSLEAELELGACVKVHHSTAGGLGLWFSNWTTLNSYPGGWFVETPLPGLYSQCLGNSESLPWGLRLAYGTGFPGEAHVIRGVGTRLWEALLWGAGRERKSDCQGRDLSKNVALVGVQVQPEPKGRVCSTNCTTLAPPWGKAGREGSCPLYSLVFMRHWPLLCGGDRWPWIGGGQFCREDSCKWLALGNSRFGGLSTRSNHDVFQVWRVGSRFTH